MSKSKNDKRATIARALLNQENAKRWGPFWEMFGLENEDTRDRLVRLLIVHLMLDSAVTALLTARFLDRRLLNPHSEIEAAVAALPMSKRIELEVSVKSGRVTWKSPTSSIAVVLTGPS